MIRRTALLALTALAAALAGCISIQLPGGMPRPLVETVVQGETGGKILMIQLDGLLTEQPRSDSFFSPGESRVARLREELDRARKDSEIDALLLRIDSPGGTVTASDILYHEIRRFKEERGVPVVAQMMGVAASGGYYVAMAADRVVAQPTTVTGSIGVVFGGINVAGLMEKIGVENQTLVSGSFKDAGSPLRDMTPAERDQLQSVLEDMFARFLSVVQQGRPDLDADTIAKLADGRIYSGPQALDHGLVDELGDLNAAVEAAERAAGLGASKVVTYHRPQEYRNNVYSVEAPPRSFDVDLQPWWKSMLPTPTFLYLWTAGF
ncbi:MAG: signal peptide peptidase SppA [Myxococcota bacterium]